MRTLRNNGMDDRTSIRPRPTKLSGAAMIVAGAVFSLFSLVPLTTAEGEAKPFAMIFGAVWILMCLSFIVYGIYILTSNKPSSGIVFDVEGNAGQKAPDPDSRYDFEMRIRKLEKLKEDRLITEDEYAMKRSEIMKEQW